MRNNAKRKLEILDLLHCWQNRCRCPATITTNAFEWYSHTLWRRWYRFASLKSAPHFSAWQHGGDTPPAPPLDPFFPEKAETAFFLSWSPLLKLIISPPPSSSSKSSSKSSSTMASLCTFSLKVFLPSKPLDSIEKGYKKKKVMVVENCGAKGWWNLE